MTETWGLTTLLPMQNSKRSGRNGKRGRRRKRISESRTRSVSDPPKAGAPSMASPTSLRKRRRARIIPPASVHTFLPSAMPRQVARCPLSTRAAWSRCTRLGMGRAIQGTPTHPTGRVNRCTNHVLRPKRSSKKYMLTLGPGPDLP